MVSISSVTQVKLDYRLEFVSHLHLYNAMKTNCYVVVVGGKYLRLMDNVMDIVDNVTENVGRRPLATFFVTEDEKITSYYSKPFHLPLVIILILVPIKSSLILHIYTW